MRSNNDMDYLQDKLFKEIGDKKIPNGDELTVTQTLESFGKSFKLHKVIHDEDRLKNRIYYNILKLVANWNFHNNLSEFLKRIAKNPKALAVIKDMNKNRGELK